MKNILGTMRAKFVDGFFILLPVLLAYLMLGQLFDGLMALTQPIVDVLPTKEKWMGVTYPEDKPQVMAGIRQRVADGYYPENLWG